SSLVITVRPNDSRYPMKLVSFGPQVVSLNPRARRMARYSSARSRSVVITHHPALREGARAGPARAALCGRPWHKPSWTTGCDAGVTVRPRATRHRPAKPRWPGNVAGDAHPPGATPPSGRLAP